MNLPKLAVIILNWNGWDYTVPCVDSCLKTDYPALSILVVDNGSDKPAPAGGAQAERLAEKYAGEARVRVIALPKNLGYAAGNNAGIREALAEPEIWGVVVLNNDTIVAPDFFRDLVREARGEVKFVGEQDGGAKFGREERHGASDMINARVMRMGAPTEIDNLGLKMTLGLLAFNRGGGKSDTHINSQLFCPSGCAVLYTRKLLEKICLDAGAQAEGAGAFYFDPTYFCYAEDVDLGWRALLAGFKPAIAENAVVYHAGSASAGSMSDFSVYHTYRNLIWTAIKCLPRWWWPLWLPMILLSYSALLALYIIRGRAPILLKAYWHGLRAWPRLLPLRRQIQKSATVKPRQLLKYFSLGLYSKNYWKRKN